MDGARETLRQFLPAGASDGPKLLISWRSLRDSNPCYSLERAIFAVSGVQGSMQ